MGEMSEASGTKVAAEEVCLATGRDCSWCSCSCSCPSSLAEEISGCLPSSMREREREREIRNISLKTCSRKGFEVNCVNSDTYI